MYDGQRIRLVLKNESVNINRLKAKAACAPNYVHSLDAAHLMSTVVLSEANGIDTFAMIHDSFGTHCSSMDVLAKATRESFVEQYSGSVLTDLYEEVLVQLPAEQQATLNLPPLQGDADLALVRDSEFFFA
jgi:DNA-directed RNA polymerase